MKTIKQLLLLSLFMFGSLAYAQVGIGTNTPNHALEVESTDSGIVIPRVASTGDVTVTPVNGTIVYDISSECMKVFENNAWSDCLSAGGGSVPSFRTTNTEVLQDSDIGNYVIYNGPGGTFDLDVLIIIFPSLKLLFPPSKFELLFLLLIKQLAHSLFAF